MNYMAQYSIRLLQFSGSLNNVHMPYTCITTLDISQKHTYLVPKYGPPFVTMYHTLSYASPCTVYTYVTMHAEHLVHTYVLLATGTK